MTPPDPRLRDLQREEQRIEARSGVFRKELGLVDLALTQVLFIIGLPWIGVAARQGPSHVVLWLAAMLLFYLPSARVVTYLNRLMPLEGGLYQWAKLGGNEMLGFLVAWNLWLFAILNASEIGLQVTQYLRYVLGPSAAALTADKTLIGAVSLAMIGALVLLTIVGLGAGKWVHKAGGALMLLTFLAIAALPWLNVAHGSLAAYHPLHARYRTPVSSILFVGATTLALSLVGLIGVGKQEAFQLLWNASGVFYALPYLAMFAIPLVGLRGIAPRPAPVLRACALSGLLMTVLYLAVSIVPLVEVESRILFAAKISGLIVTANVLGLMIYLARRRRAGATADR